MAPVDEPLEVEAAGRAVRITNPHKEFFARIGLTKAGLAEYYLAVEGPLMEAMGGRPVLMERYPDGVPGKSFFQKRVPASRPDWLRTTVVSTPNGTTSDALVVDDVAHVLWAVNLGCLGFHVWPTRASDPTHADELRFDLDPMPRVTFDEVRTAASLVREMLDGLGIRSWVKTSGSRGLHVYVPLLPRWGSTTVRSAAVAAARELARRHPGLLTDAWWKEERGRRVFVDFNQNAPHKTVFGAWSVRPRVGAQVSTPIRWEELDSVDPESLTALTVPATRWRAGGPVGGSLGGPSVDRSAARTARTGHGRRPHGRPMATPVSQDAERTPRVAPSRARGTTPPTAN
ncbi:MAG: non-homologous end-joining DNA ligase [Microthrixaceae bacterium]|nr:non-homologous end-joining DNA ligase [Microthrixaceae bacterium]